MIVQSKYRMKMQQKHVKLGLIYKKASIFLYSRFNYLKIHFFYLFFYLKRKFLFEYK